MSNQAAITLATLRSAAKKFKATVENVSSGDNLDYEAWAPLGSVWLCGSHVLVGSTPIGKGRLFPAEKKWKAEMMQDLLDRINSGVQDCTDTDCDLCKTVL